MGKRKNSILTKWAHNFMTKIPLIHPEANLEKEILPLPPPPQPPSIFPPFNPLLLHQLPTLNIPVNSSTEPPIGLSLEASNIQPDILLSGSPIDSSEFFTASSSGAPASSELHSIQSPGLLEGVPVAFVETNYGSPVGSPSNVSSLPNFSSPLKLSPLNLSPLQLSPIQLSPLSSLQLSPLSSLQLSPLSPLQLSPFQLSPLQTSPLKSSPIDLSLSPHFAPKLLPAFSPLGFAAFDWPISSDKERQIKTILHGNDGDEVTFHYQQVLLRHDYATMLGNRWFNDHVIGCYWELLSTKCRDRRVISISSYFFIALNRNSSPAHSNVRSWTKNLSIFDQDFLLIPIFEQVIYIIELPA